MLSQLADTLGGHNAAMTLQAGKHAEAVAVQLDPAAPDLFTRYYAARNPLPNHSEIDQAFGRRAVVVRPKAREILLRSEYYNDFLKPFGLAHLAWIFLDRQASSVALINIGRPEHLEPFDSATLDRFTFLMPHLMRSYRISRRLGGLGAAGRLLEQYLDLLPQGVVLLDTIGRVMHANRAAQVIVAARDGLSFGTEGLLVTSPAAQRRLQAAVMRAADRRAALSQAQTLAVPRPSGVRPYALAVCPFDDHPSPLLFGRPSVLVEIRDLASHDEPAAEWLADCLGLTAAESRVASLLLSGLDRDGVAKQLGVASNTIRVHVARIMAKTDTHRQPELVHLLGKVASLRRGAPQPGPMRSVA